MCVAAAIAGAGVVGAGAAVYSSSKASSAADKATDAASASADKSAALGQEQLDFDKQQYNDQKGYRDQASTLALQGAQLQNDAAKTQSQIAAETNDYQNSTFRPLEKQIVSTAEGYDTPERRAAAEAESAANVEQSYGSAQDGLARSLARTGNTYGSGRSQALMQDAALSKAGALAGATTGASRNVETVGAAKMADAANLGRNLASNQTAQVASSINATNSSTAAGSAAIADAASGVSAVNQGYSGAVSANLGAGSLYNNVASSYNTQAAQANAGLGALGSAFGQYAGTTAGSNYLTNLFGGSDENIKSGTGKKIDTKKALEGIEKTPVHKGWMYDAAKGAPPEVAGDWKHDGAMAQDMADNMGPEVSDGKKFSQPSINGHMMAAIQELAKRQKKMAKSEKKEGA